MALTLTKITPQDEYTYIPESQRGETKPFSVTFKRIPLDKLAVLQDESIGIKQSGTYTININSQHYNALKVALVGWSNITEGKKAIKFRIVRGVASDESLELLPADIRAEIASVIIEVSKDPSNADEYLNGDILEDTIDGEN